MLDRSSLCRPSLEQVLIGREGRGLKVPKELLEKMCSMVFTGETTAPFLRKLFKLWRIDFPDRPQAYVNLVWCGSVLMSRV